MMLCVDKKMLHDCRRDQVPAPFAAGAEPGGRGVHEHPADGHAGPLSPQDQDRHEVMLRVIRVSDALNRRLAL